MGLLVFVLGCAACYIVGYHHGQAPPSDALVMTEARLAWADACTAPLRVLSSHGPVRRGGVSTRDQWAQEDARIVAERETRARAMSERHQTVRWRQAR